MPGVLPPLNIRILTPDDVAIFKELRLESLAAHPDIYRSTLESWQGQDAMFADRLQQALVFCAFDGARPLGCATLALHARKGEKTRHKAEVWGVYIRPEARGRGVGLAIMSALIAHARSLGLEALILGVVTTNAAAQALYARLGFLRYGREERVMKLPDGSYRDEDYLELRLV